MNKKIIDGNLLIAEFMGLRIDYHPDKSDSWLVDVKNIDSIYHNVPFDEIVFHSSWDWLMPVVEKIETSHWSVNIEDFECKIYGLYQCQIEVSELKKIDAVYKAVIQFIKWHNTQKLKE